MQVETLIQKIESDFASFSAKLEESGMKTKLNIDDNYKETIIEAIDFKQKSITQLLTSRSGSNFEEVRGAALLNASKLGLVDGVKQLLKAGAKPQLTDRNNCTSLSLAIQN